MVDVNLEMIESWCQDALTLLPTPDLPESIAELRRATIRRHSGTNLLYRIAEDLAEGLSDLPLKEREMADRALKNKYGFSHEIFTDKKVKWVSAIMKKGKISNDDEFREVSNLASNSKIDVEIAKLINKLIFDYESRK